MTRTLYEYELDFFSAAFCADAERLAARFADDFVEFGQSGGTTNKQSVVEALSRMTRDRRIEIRNFVACPLAEGVALATYRAIEEGGRTSKRSSIWVRDGEAGPWKLRFHQGTTIPER